MRKRNASLSTMPDAPIDLTSLLDIIFIFLFIVVIGYAQRVNQAETSAREKAEALQMETEQLQAKLLEYQTRDYDAEVLKKSYEESLRQYEELDRLVHKITIYCTYRPDDFSQRTIRVIAPNREYEPIEVNVGNENLRFAQLKQLLTDHIESVQGDFSNEDETTERQSFVIMSLSMEQIQRRDREQIDQIAAELTEQYGDVFYRKFKNND